MVLHVSAASQLGKSTKLVAPTLGNACGLSTPLQKTGRPLYTVPVQLPTVVKFVP